MKQKEVMNSLMETTFKLSNAVDQLTSDICNIDDRLSDIEVKAGVRDNSGYPIKGSGIPSANLAPMPAAWDNPFEGHDSYVSIYNAQRGKECAKSPNSVMVGLYFSDNGKDIDRDIPISICDDGVYAIKNNNWEKVEVTAPLFVGTIERPTGMYISTDVSLEGAKQARDFLNDIIGDEGCNDDDGIIVPF